jgi:ribosomal protein S12 methylthiotransferase accessory factor
MMALSPLLPGVSGSTSKAFKAGTHRLFEPERTLDLAHPLLERMGITRIANVTGLDRIGIPVVQVVRPNSRALAVSQGKGVTLTAAKASAVMESIESYHAERITLPLKLASYEEMRARYVVVDVTDLNRPIPTTFHRHLPVLWIEGNDLMQNEPVWLPYEVVHTNYTRPFPTGGGCFTMTSTGLASGNHLLEAVSHGICEVVEQDAMTLWALSGAEGRARMRVDLETIHDPACREVLDKFQRARIEVRVWETTTDVGIPAFHCTIRDGAEASGASQGDGGHGSHPSRPIALLRALTEAAQTRLTVIVGSRDDVVRSNYERRWGNRAGWREEPAEFEGTGCLRHFEVGPTWDGETFEEDIRWQLARLQSVGIQRVVVVDLTKPELGLPVVRVVILGLEISFGIDLMSYALGKRAQSIRKGRR